MPVVEVRQVVAAPIDGVYQLVSDMASYPKFMDSVESIDILERGANYTLSQWVARLQGARFRWVEKDWFFPDTYRITYNQIEGDLKVFRGHWALRPVETGTEVELVTEFEFGLPMMAPLLNPVAKVALGSNARAMLRAIGRQFTGSHGPGSA
jgi:coenzyme Q-binding protein COQ10